MIVNMVPDITDIISNAPPTGLDIIIVVSDESATIYM